MVNAATQFVQQEGFGQGAPAHLGPQALPSVGEAIVNQDGIEILDADVPLSTVMSPLSAFLSPASPEAGDAQAQAGQEALQLMTGLFWHLGEQAATLPRLTRGAAAPASR